MQILNTEKATPCLYQEEDCEYVHDPLICWCDPANMLIGGRNPKHYCPEITKHLFEAANAN
jgi:hypothetical protein